MLLPAGDMMELLETIGCGGAGAGAGVESDAVEPVEATFSKGLIRMAQLVRDCAPRQSRLMVSFTCRVFINFNYIYIEQGEHLCRRRHPPTAMGLETCNCSIRALRAIIIESCFG